MTRRRRGPDLIEIGTVLVVLVLIGFFLKAVTGQRGADVDGEVATPAGQEPSTEGPVDPQEPSGDPKAYRLDYSDPATGAPVRFNPCEPLHYVMNGARMPEWAEPIVHDAVREMAAASGIEMVFDGPTEESPPKVARLDDSGGIITKEREVYDPKRYGRKRWSPLLFAWEDLPEGPDGPIAGVGRASAARAPGGQAVLVSGALLLDYEVPTPRDLKSTVMHELGHILGLAHVEDAQQLMHPSVSLGGAAARLGAGDLNGLRAVGRDAGCLPSVTPPAPRVELRHADAPG